MNLRATTARTLLALTLSYIDVGGTSPSQTSGLGPADSSSIRLTVDETGLDVPVR